MTTMMMMMMMMMIMIVKDEDESNDYKNDVWHQHKHYFTMELLVITAHWCSRDEYCCWIPPCTESSPHPTFLQWTGGSLYCRRCQAGQAGIQLGHYQCTQAHNISNSVKLHYFLSDCVSLKLHGFLLLSWHQRARLNHCHYQGWPGYIGSFSLGSIQTYYLLQ